MTLWIMPEWSEKKKGEGLHGGHVTGSFVGGSREGLQRAPQTQYSFSEY